MLAASVTVGAIRLDNHLRSYSQVKTRRAIIASSKGFGGETKKAKQAKEAAEVAKQKDIKGKGAVSTIPRGKILQSCALTSIAVGLLGVGLNFGSKFLHQPDLPFVELDLPDFGLSVAATVFVTLCRVGMVNFNEEYRISFDLSNRTVLSELSLSDTMLISSMSGTGEEMLFRGGLIPILGTNNLAVAISSLVFGALHYGDASNRGIVFSTFAGFVGLVYGVLTLKSGQVAPAIFAHTASNALAALYWKNFMADSTDNINIEVDEESSPRRFKSEEVSQ